MKKAFYDIAFHSLSLFLLLLAALPSAMADPGEPSSAGGDLFKTYCATCHGLDGRGKGPASPALKKAPANLRSISARNGGTFPTQAIISKIDGREDLEAHGSREMPIWGKQFGQDDTFGEEIVRGNLQVLVEYLQSIQERPADTNRGK